ncbi:MAG: lipocalin family protein [Deltaproteobacteria bacterium]
MMKTLAAALFILIAASRSIAADVETLEVAPSVDLSRYCGKWYEIARLPNRFEKNCAADVTAEYYPAKRGELKVVNQCRNAEGAARRADGDSRLEVRFAPSWLSWLPFMWGDYWILELDEDYRYSLVGTPDRKYLWILARAPEIEQHLYLKLTDRARAEGFDTTRLIKTPHAPK